MVNGEHTIDKDGHVVCKCGRADCFRMITHIDFTDRAVTNYQCSNCGNVVEIVAEREMPWM